MRIEVSTLPRTLYFCLVPPRWFSFNPERTVLQIIGL
jgi:hypothetical protein